MAPKGAHVLTPGALNVTSYGKKDFEDLLN